MAALEARQVKAKPEEIGFADAAVRRNCSTAGGSSRRRRNTPRRQGSFIHDRIGSVWVGENDIANGDMERNGW